jgi:hypothetical protein
VLLALVWVLPHSKKLFESYFEVLFIDGTHTTNNKDCPLLTIAAKDGYGNVHVILHAFIPNEQWWLFRWLFQTAVPSLLGRQICDKVKLIVTDSDAQEIDQLNKALRTTFKSSRVLATAYVAGTLLRRRGSVFLASTLVESVMIRRWKSKKLSRSGYTIW